MCTLHTTGVPPPILSLCAALRGYMPIGRLELWDGGNWRAIAPCEGHSKLVAPSPRQSHRTLGAPNEKGQALGCCDRQTRVHLDNSVGIGSRADMRCPPQACGHNANDAVDGAHSAASKCHRVVASKRTTLRGAVHGRGYHDRSRYREVGFFRLMEWMLMARW